MPIEVFQMFSPIEFKPQHKVYISYRFKKKINEFYTPGKIHLWYALKEYALIYYQGDYAYVTYTDYLWELSSI